MRRYLNGTRVPLSLAVFLAHDNYDYDPDPYTVSATTLIKPLRQTILASRLTPEQQLTDLLAQVNNRIGSAVHEKLESVWINHYRSAMAALGYPEHVIERIRINPDPANLDPDCIPVYLEQRAYRRLGKYTISGKFDFVAEGRVEDLKTTKVYTWIQNNKDEDYILQGSIYRWLNPQIITRDEMAIQFIFTDWTAAKVQSDPAYPPAPVMTRVLPLKSLNETEAYIRQRLDLLERYRDAPEPELPECNDAELWRKPPQFKYYRDPSKTTRATKNFDTAAEAYARLRADGGGGLVKEVPGQVSACKYCPAFVLCSQKDRLIAAGDLVL